MFGLTLQNCKTMYIHSFSMVNQTYTKSAGVGEKLKYFNQILSNYFVFNFNCHVSSICEMHRLAYQLIENSIYIG